MITIKPHNLLNPTSSLTIALSAIEGFNDVTIDLSAIEPTDSYLNDFVINLIDNDAKRYKKYVTLTGIEQSRIDELLLARRKYHIKKSRALPSKFKANYHNVRDKLGRFVKVNIGENSTQSSDDAFLDGFEACERLVRDRRPRSANNALIAWKKYK
jgi:hypothetical protein